MSLPIKAKPRLKGVPVEHQRPRGIFLYPSVSRMWSRQTVPRSPVQLTPLQSSFGLDEPPTPVANPNAIPQLEGEAPDTDPHDPRPEDPGPAIEHEDPGPIEHEDPGSEQDINV